MTIVSAIGQVSKPQCARYVRQAGTDFWRPRFNHLIFAISEHRRMAFHAVIITALTSTGCSAKVPPMQNDKQVFTTLKEARAANPDVRKLDSEQLNKLFASSIRLTFPATPKSSDFHETIDPSHQWSYYEPGAVLYQIAGHWSISNNMLCVNHQPRMGYQGKESFSISICREIWADPSMRYGIIRSAIETSAPYRLYRVKIEKLILKPGHVIDKLGR